MTTIRPASPPFSRPAFVSKVSPLLDPAVLVSQLGLKTRFLVDGSVYYNEPLIQQVLALREKAMPSIGLLLASTNRTTTILEGLETATRMREAGIFGVEKLAPVVSRFNAHFDPAVQVHLARFYGKINRPKGLGYIYG